MLGKWFNSFLHRPRAILYAAWAVVLLGLFWEARYQVFLRPEFGIFIAMGAMVFIALMVVEMRQEQEPITLRALSRLGILFVPLLFLTRAQSFTLDTYAFEKRTTLAWQNNTQQALSIPVRGKIPPASLQEDYSLAFKATQKPVVGGQSRPMLATPTPTADEQQDARAEVEMTDTKRESAMAEDATLSMLSLMPEEFTGHKVSVIGMVQHNSKVAEYLGADSFVLFRFMVVCCAADARPMAAAVQMAKPRAFEKDEWVKVEGLFEVKTTPHGPLPVIGQARVEKTEKPTKVYLF